MRRRTLGRRQRSQRRLRRQRQQGGAVASIEDWGAAMLRQFKDARTRTPLDTINFAAMMRSDDLNLDRAQQFSVQLYDKVAASMYDIAAVTHDALQDIATLQEYKQMRVLHSDDPEAAQTFDFLANAEEKIRAAVFARQTQSPPELADAPAADNPVVLMTMIVNIAQSVQQQRPILGPATLPPAVPVV